MKTVREVMESDVRSMAALGHEFNAKRKTTLVTKTDSKGKSSTRAQGKAAFIESFPIQERARVSRALSMCQFVAWVEKAEGDIALVDRLPSAAFECILKQYESSTPETEFILNVLEAATMPRHTGEAGEYIAMTFEQTGISRFVDYATAYRNAKKKAQDDRKLLKAAKEFGIAKPAKIVSIAPVMEAIQQPMQLQA